VSFVIPRPASHLNNVYGDNNDISLRLGVYFCTFLGQLPDGFAVICCFGGVSSRILSVSYYNTHFGKEWKMVCRGAGSICVGVCVGVSVCVSVWVCVCLCVCVGVWCVCVGVRVSAGSWCRACPTH